MSNFDCEKCLHDGVCYRQELAAEKTQLEIYKCNDYKDRTLFDELLFYRGMEAYKIEKNCDDCGYFDDDWLYGEDCFIDKTIFKVDFDRGCKYKIKPIKIFWENLDDYGKTIFLTEKDAESKLLEAGVRKCN